MTKCLYKKVFFQKFYCNNIKLNRALSLNTLHAQDMNEACSGTAVQGPIVLALRILASSSAVNRKDHITSNNSNWIPPL